MNQEKIGKFIAENRRKEGLTQEELAEKLNVSKNAVSKWERGLCLMDMSLLKPLSEILKVSINEILSGERIIEEEYQEKFEENIINAIDYSNRQISKKSNLIGIILIAVGIIMSIIAMTIFTSESSWGGIFSFLGGIVSLIGVGAFTKKWSYPKRFFCNVLYFLLFICLLFLIDYLSVINIKQPPRFCLEKITYDNMIIYKTPFYNVFRMNVDSLNEYYVIDIEKIYTKETIPITPFNKEKSGIENIIKYKNKDLNNRTNTEKLISNLPLSEYPFDFKIDEENLGLIINYNATDWQSHVSHYLKRSLLYNAVSIFVLIENVEYIDFNISLPYDNDSYHIDRETVESLYPNYKYIIQKNVDKYNFNRDLETPINDYEFMIYNFKVLFIDANLKNARKIEVLGYREK